MTPSTASSSASPPRVSGVEDGRRSVFPEAIRHPQARRAYVLANRDTATNRSLARALSARGLDARVGPVEAVTDPRPGDVAIVRLDVLRTLDGVEPGLWQARRLERRGVRLLNDPISVLAAHDKLSTMLLLGRVGIPQAWTAHVWAAGVPRSVAPPYVVKPRFGSWGQDVVRCDDEESLVAYLQSLRGRPWFRRHGALVQELLETGGSDMRLVVAGGRVIGGIERRALSGEWRTNVSLGGTRHPLVPPVGARVLALRAAAAIGGDLVGVDLVRCHDGRYVVLEVNGAVDFTSAYGVDGLDPFEAAADALLEAVDAPIRGAAATPVSA